MNAVPHRLALLPAVLLVLLPLATALAQSTTNPPRAVPPMPVAKSPVDAFRELLALDANALRAALSNRNEVARERLRKKLNEYKAMDNDERQLRLFATELRWHVSRLMLMSPTNRVAVLAEVRDDLRPLVESRLARWDALEEELRQVCIQNEEAMSLLLKIGQASSRLQQQLAAQVKPEMRDELHRALARLDAMSPAERARAFDVFENIFTVTPTEQAGALRVMSETEKRQMEQTLGTFNQLSVTQRKACIRSYEKFVGMTPVERALFLRNVQIWEKMSPKERQQWRDVVKNVEILPPIPEARPPMPPMPPAALVHTLTNKT